MSFQQHQLGELSARPFLNAKSLTGNIASEYLLANSLEHTYSTGASQVLAAVELDPSFQCSCISAGHHTGAEPYAKGERVDRVIPETHYSGQEPHQLFPTQYSASMIEFLSAVDFAASINSQYDLCGDSTNEWTEDLGSLYLSTSFSQETYGPSMFESLTPQTSPFLMFPPTPTASHLPVMMLQQPLHEAQPSLDKQRQYICKECNKHKIDLKSLNRHMTEVHRKPHQGQVQRGWFTCVCGYQACYSRRCNYTRHLQKCKATGRVHQEYICQCLLKHADKAVHEKHYQTCKEGAGHVGRPRRQP